MPSTLKAQILEICRCCKLGNYNGLGFLTGNWHTYYRAVVEDLFHNAQRPSRFGSLTGSKVALSGRVTGQKCRQA